VAKTGYTKNGLRVELA